MTQTELFQLIKERLRAIFGDRLKGLILYGSEARGDARQDSDIDMLALLEGPVSDWNDISRIVDATYALQLEYGRLLNILPVDTNDYQKNYPLYIEARKDGIPI
ncbi:MAG: nucleotidyltransferase domain-containing protein [bacterium]